MYVCVSFSETEYSSVSRYDLDFKKKSLFIHDKSITLCNVFQIIIFPVPPPPLKAGWWYWCSFNRYGIFNNFLSCSFFSLRRSTKQWDNPKFISLALFAIRPHHCYCVTLMQNYKTVRRCLDFWNNFTGNIPNFLQEKKMKRWEGTQIFPVQSWKRRVSGFNNTLLQKLKLTLSRNMDRANCQQGEKNSNSSKL